MLERYPTVSVLIRNRIDGLSLISFSWSWGRLRGKDRGFAIKNLHPEPIRIDGAFAGPFQVLNGQYSPVFPHSVSSREPLYLKDLPAEGLGH